MMHLFKNFINTITTQEKKPIIYSVLFLAISFCIVGFFNKTLAVGLLLLLFLTVATLFIIFKTIGYDKNTYIIFLIALLVHFGAVLFIYYGHFKPFGGGADFEGYNQIGIEIAHRFGNGNFSLEGLYTDHFFPILIGILYLLTLPSMIVGQLFVVWLAAISILLVYLIAQELGATKKAAFLASLIVIVYPSYLYFGSILLKDTVVTPLALAGLLLTIKMAKKFSWIKFLVFFIILTSLINLRFYVGYALMFSFIFSWPLLSAFSPKKKIIYWLIMVVLLGFSPQFVDNGYYASSSFKKFLTPKNITYYREILYSNSPESPLNTKPSEPQVVASLPVDQKPTISEPTITQPSQPVNPKPVIPVAPQPTTSEPTIAQPNTSQPNQSSSEEFGGSASTFFLETGFTKGALVFLKNSSQSFIYSLLGPFPWQFQYKRQMVGLVETIPWYILILASFYSCARFIRKNGVLKFLKLYKFSLPLFLFSVLVLGALSLFINNYGIIARIRVPVFICLALIMCVVFNTDLENYYLELRNAFRRFSLNSRTKI